MDGRHVSRRPDLLQNLPGYGRPDRPGDGGDMDQFDRGAGYGQSSTAGVSYPRDYRYSRVAQIFLYVFAAIMTGGGAWMIDIQIMQSASAVLLWVGLAMVLLGIYIAMSSATSCLILRADSVRHADRSSRECCAATRLPVVVSYRREASRSWSWCPGADVPCGSIPASIVTRHSMPGSMHCRTWTCRNDRLGSKTGRRSGIRQQSAGSP